MKRPSPIECRRYPFAVAAGVLLALSFPKSDLAVGAWLAPGGLLLSTLGLSKGAAFRVGYVGALAHYLLVLRWLLHIPFPAGAVAGWLALSAFLALFPALWTAFAWPAAALPNFISLKPPTETTPGPLRRPTESVWLRAADGHAARPWNVRVGLGLLAAAMWVAMEMVIARIFGGFPWNFLGASQYRNIPLIQMAAFTGINGVSFLVCWCSVTLGSAMVLLVRRPAQRWGWMAELRLALFTLLVLLGIGFFHLVGRPPANPRLRLALIQPSIPQKVIFDPDESTNRFNQIFRLSEAAVATRPDVLVWPEASLPDVSPDQFGEMTNLVASSGVWWIFGSQDSEPGADGPRYFNSAFLFNPRGGYADTYRKRHLVIFGEFVPLERWLPFLRHLTPIGGSFSAGEGPGTFHLGDTRAQAAPMICFEDTFAHTTREHVKPETDFILDLTNNGWFGHGGAQWQHTVNAVFRAVENRVVVVRCTNDGLTCWIDELGRIRDLLRDSEGSEYGAGFRVVGVPLRSAGTPVEPTFYNRYGDVFGWGCVAITAVALLQARRRRI